MEVGEGMFVGGRGKGAVVGEVGGDRGEESRLEGVFHEAGTGMEGDQRVGRMVGAECTGKVLGAEEFEMVGDREDFGFRVEVVLGGVLEGASAEPEGTVLDSLEFGDVGEGGVRKPNWGSVGENGADEGFVGLEHCLLLVSPGGTSKGFENVEAGGGTGGNGGDVGGEIEVGVESDAEDLGIFCEGKRGIVDGDIWVEVGLVVVGGEEGDGGFVGGDGETVGGGPVRYGGEVGIDEGF